MEIIWEKNYPNNAKRRIEIPEVSIYQLFKEAVKNYGPKEAICFYNITKTYSEIEIDVERIASGLSALGLKRGDKLAVLLPNCLQYVYIFFACSKLGVTLVNINSYFTFNEIKNLISITKAKTIFVFVEYITKIIDLFPIALDKIIIVRTELYFTHILNSIPGLKTLLIHDELPRDKNIMFMIDVGKNLPPVDEVPVDPKKDIALIHFTGGVTGIPKGAAISHYNLISNIYILNEWLKDANKEELAVIGTTPYFHVFGISFTMILPMFFGAKIELITHPEDLNSIINAIEKNHNTFYPDLPARFSAFLEDMHIRKISVNGTLRVMSGASMLSESVRTNFKSKFGIKLYQGYGMTESPIVSLCPFDDDVDRGSSVGLPLPNTSVRIVDLKTGINDMPLGESGELIVKGPQVIKEYLTDTINKPAVKDGWLYTGDMARIDENGFIYITGRKKELILVSGMSVYPYEVEKFIKSNPKVEECAVVGMPDLMTEEAVVAFIVIKNSRTLTTEEIMDYCRKNMAKYKVPQVVLFVDHLPKNVLGKVLKNELKKLVK